MATLNTAQRVSFTVTDANGNLVPEPLSTGLIAGEGVVTDTTDNATGIRYIVAIAPGDFTFKVWKGAQSGTISGTVEDAPLTITLGVPEPKL